MFSLGGSEVIVILLVALIVLGPDKLPDTARKIGNVMGELRRMSHGFQQEIKSAPDDAVKEQPAPTAPNEAAATPPHLERVPDEATATSPQTETRPDDSA